MAAACWCFLSSASCLFAVHCCADTFSLLDERLLMSQPPNHALQRTRPSHRCCNPRVWAGSLSLGRSVTVQRLSTIWVFCALGLTGCGGNDAVVDGVNLNFPLTNQPPLASIRQFAVARPLSPYWYALPRKDGEFILRSISSIAERESDAVKVASNGVLPPPNQFAVAAMTRNQETYLLTFTTNAHSVWRKGHLLLEVPQSVATQIVQSVERALRTK
jgi:hypothetical protein